MPEELTRGFRLNRQDGSTYKARTNHLFVIGINDYKTLPRLNKAVSDAQLFVNTLTELYDFHPDHIVTLFDEAATERSILKRFREFIPKMNKNHNLIVYFAGHGYFDTLEQKGYWIPVDGEEDAVDTYISNDRIISIVKAIKTQHTVLFIDSCFSGTLFDAIRSITTRLDNKQSRWALTSGRNEPVADNSPFAKYLIDFLKTTEKDQILISEIAQYIKTIGARNSNQTPYASPLMNVDDRGGEFVFRKKKTGTTDTASTPLPSASIDKEAILWEFIKERHQIVFYENYLATYPHGKYAAEAKANIKVLENAYQPTEDNNIFDDTYKEFTDDRDGQQYKVIKAGGRIWMAENLNFKTSDAWHYDQNAQLGNPYGCLYTYKSAKRACPKGWRLPTDKEWRMLLEEQGGFMDGISNEPYGNPEEAYQNLIKGGFSGINIELAGGIMYANEKPLEFSELGETGYYWSATKFEPGSDEIIGYSFDDYEKTVWRSDFYWSNACSIRCVKDIDYPKVETNPFDIEEEERSIYTDPFENGEELPIPDAKAHEIIQAYIQTFGGFDNIDAIEDVEIQMTVRNWQGETLQCTHIFQRQGKEYKEFRKGQNIIQQYFFDGEYGGYTGEYNNFQLTGSHLEDAIHSDFFWELYYRELGYTPTYIGSNKDQYGTLLHQIDWRTPGGNYLQQYYTAEQPTKVLENKVTQNLMGVTTSQTWQYTDFRAVEGVVFPFVIYEMLNQQHVATYSVTSIRINQYPKDSIFKV